MTIVFHYLLFFLIWIILLVDKVGCCTNYLVTSGASTDGSNMISYSADTPYLYGELVHFPHDYPAPGTMRKIYNWDTGEYQGEIPEVSELYNVVGNINEFNLVIGETTFGGRSELDSQPGAILDYGNLIWITLQRSRTAREAIQTLTSLANQFGYTSTGESFSIADPNEVWMMDLIGKGPGQKGVVWVALKIPEGYVASHANKARIQNIPFEEKDNCMYAPDVVDFAKMKGFYPSTGSNEDFQFANTYDPPTFENVRAGDIRVWSFFHHITPEGQMEHYVDYIKGVNLTRGMPLWVKPVRKLSLSDVMMYMKDHLEETPFDFRKDIGAGPFQLPYRWRPVTWEIEKDQYFNERAVATQQTVWSFVAHVRKSLPAPIGGVLWFGMDDTACTVYVPMYCGITRPPPSYTRKYGGVLQFSFNSAFWVANMVANLAYTRWKDMYPEVQRQQSLIQDQFQRDVATTDAKALELWKHNKASETLELLTQFSVTAGENTTAQWLSFWQYLFPKYMDGYIKTIGSNGRLQVDTPGYPKEWGKRIIQETGNRYHVPTALQSKQAKVHSTSKRIEHL